MEMCVCAFYICMLRREQPDGLALSDGGDGSATESSLPLATRL